MTLLNTLADEVAYLVERVGPSVLHVRAIRGRRARLSGGSAAVVTPDGYALTNSHVVSGTAGIEVELADRRAKVDGNVQHAPVRDSNALRVGEFALAVGRRSVSRARAGPQKREQFPPGVSVSRLVAGRCRG